METAKSEFYIERLPNVLPVRPTSLSSITILNPKDRNVPSSSARVLAQPEPYDNVDAITYKAEELKAMSPDNTMGIVMDGITYALVKYYRSDATFIEELRNPDRVTRETAKSLDLALNPQAEAAQFAKDLEAAKLRLESHLDALESDLLQKYNEIKTQAMPKEIEVSADLTKTVKRAMTDSLEDSSLEEAVTEEDIEAFLKNAAEKANKKAKDDFNQDTNCKWEECVDSVFTFDADLKKYFSCTADMSKALLASGIKPRTLQLDNNPKHIVTLGMVETNRPTRLKFIAKHESGEEISARVSKRRPPITRTGYRSGQGGGSGGH